MKILTVLLLGAALLLSATSRADDDKKDKDLPPGLRKKDKLPPGWEKKQHKEAEENAAKPSTAPATAGTPAPPAPPSAPAKVRTPKELKAELDQHVGGINRLSNKPAVLHAGFAAIARETSVSLTTIEAQHRQHPSFGTGGLLLANLVASHTRQPVSRFIKQREEGKSWYDIAVNNQLDLAVLNEKAARVEQAMRETK